MLRIRQSAVTIETKMNTKDVLLDFLNHPLDTAGNIFNKFLSLPDAKLFQGNNPGERFLFIKGNRPDAATLVAHADTVFDASGEHKIIEDGDIFRSGSSDYGLGADDRAGCAMLWLLRDMGHHILICDYEESTHNDAVGNCTGSKYLMREYRDIAQIVNLSSFVFEFDRRLAYGVRKEHYTSYWLPVSKEFREFVESNTDFMDDDNRGYTDIIELCRDVCGANICVGYTNAHTANETISISAFQNTYKIMRKLLSQELKRFPLVGKETNSFFPPQIIPEWLKHIAYLYRIEPNLKLKEEMKKRIKEQMRNTDFHDILKDSLYYSGCGNDITPIKFFEKHIHSFVFCLDATCNLGYDTEFESVKAQLKNDNYKKRVNIDLDIEYFKKNNFSIDDKWLRKNADRFKANWSIWEHNNDFFSLLFIACDSFTAWKNIYQNNQIHPKVFHFQGMFDAWKGGLGKNEGDKFIVNSEIYSDGLNVFKNNVFLPY